MTLIESQPTTPPMNPEQINEVSLIDSLNGQRDEFVRRENLRLASEIASKLDTQTILSELTGTIPQVDVNLGAPAARLMTGPLRRNGLVEISRFGSNPLSDMRPKEGATRNELVLAYRGDEEFQNYKAALRQAADNFKVSTDGAAYSETAFSLFDSEGSPADADFLLTLTGNDFIHISDGEEDEVFGQAEMFRNYVAELPEMRDGIDNTQAGRFFDIDGNLTRILIPKQRPGFYLALKAAGPNSDDVLKQSFQIGFETNPNEVTMESTDGTYNKAEPFIESDTAQSLLKVITSVGLEPTDTLRNCFAETFEGRTYGHGFAELSREIAKLVGLEDRSLSTLFEGGITDIKDSLDRINPEEIDSFATMVIADLLKQLVDRELNPNNQYSSDIPVTRLKTSIKTGSCRDSERNFCLDHSKFVDINGKKFLTKSAGDKTYMNTEPVMFNGILLQPGALFGRNKDDEGYAMLRLSAFSIGDDAKDAFGIQYEEVLRSVGDRGVSYQEVQAIINGIV